MLALTGLPTTKDGNVYEAAFFIFGAIFVSRVTTSVALSKTVDEI